METNFYQEKYFLPFVANRYMENKVSSLRMFLNSLLSVKYTCEIYTKIVKHNKGIN